MDYLIPCSQELPMEGVVSSSHFKDEQLTLREVRQPTQGLWELENSRLNLNPSNQSLSATSNLNFPRGKKYDTLNHQDD